MRCCRGDRTADFEDAWRMGKVPGDHRSISIAKAMSYDLVFGVDRDQDNFFEADEADEVDDKPGI